MRIRYRVEQLWQMLTAAPLPNDVHHEISSILSDREMGLFGRLSLHDQWHSYRVLSALRAAGHSHPSLLVAALLHDVGKAQVPLSIWERSLIVLVNSLLPQRAVRWGDGEPRGWKRPFVVKVRHPLWGAKMAKAIGSSPLTVNLIRRHQEVLPETILIEEDLLLQQLQWADDQN